MNSLHRWIWFLLLSPLAALPEAGAKPGVDQPNFVIVFTDDLGYGDLGCYGHPSIRTPHLDRMALEGLRFTDFYAAAPVCTPSRAALLTGRHAIRSGMGQMPGTRGVLFPDSKGGLPPEEITLAAALKTAGYATAHIGKWHLGIHEGSRPQDHGFDTSYGLPYSNDMDRRPDLPGGARYWPDPPADGWNVPLLGNGEVIERPAHQATLTQRYTAEALKFIAANRGNPFFLYLAHTMPHTPLFASTQFQGRSLRGLYGDVVEELDWSTGEVLEALRRERLDSRTLVIFTSDNGPWLSEREQGGSAGLLRDGKGSTWEGGVRVPGIAWMPGSIRPGITSEPCSTLDLLPTVLALAGVALPTGVTLDGEDLAPLLFTGRPLRPRPYFYYRGHEVFACRLGDWKAHFITQGGFGGPARAAHDPPLLFHLPRDPSEQFNVAAEHLDVIARIRAAVETHQAGVVPGRPQLK